MNELQLWLYHRNLKLICILAVQAKTFFSTGAWVCFTRLSQLRPDVLSCFGELLRSVITALQTRQSFVGILGEEHSLDPNGSCLATLDPFVRISRNDPQWMTRVPAAALDLPCDIRDRFRVISLAAPSIQQTAEVLLLSRGLPEIFLNYFLFLIYFYFLSSLLILYRVVIVYLIENLCLISCLFVIIFQL